MTSSLTNAMKYFASIAFALLTVASAHAQGTTRSPLVGTWSEPGRCGVSARVLTDDGRYLWLEREGGAWTTTYRGVYVIKSTTETRLRNPAIVIAEGYQMDGFMFEIVKLTQSELIMVYLGSDDPDDPGGERTSWIRCPTRSR